MIMKEMHVDAGERIDRACERLAREAPAFMVFNDIRVDARGGESPGDLHGAWLAESDRRRAEYEASDLYKQRKAEAEVRAKREAVIRDEALAVVARSDVRAKYAWIDGMGEISGFGGGYESACRDMLYAGLAWLETKPGADLQASIYRNVYGILNADSEDAKALEKALMQACPDCSGAMHQATMSAVMFIAKNGWAKYVDVMTERSTRS